MTKLPNADLAIIDETKTIDYLLSSNHPAGRSKAAFFRRLGFEEGSSQQLRDALLEHARKSPVISVIETAFGKKYIIEGPLMVSDARAANLCAVWFVETGSVAPRLVTAYPVLRGEQ